MGVNDRKISVTLDIGAQVTDFNKSIADIQKQLQQLQLPKDVNDSVKGLLDDYSNEIQKIEKLLEQEGGKLTPVNEKEVAKSSERIERLYRALFKKINSNSVQNSLLTKDQKIVNTLVDLQDKYKDKVKAVNKEIDKQEKALRDITATTTGKNARVDEAKKAYNEATKALDDFNTENKQNLKNLEEQKKLLEDAEEIEKRKKNYVAQKGNLRGFPQQEAARAARIEADLNKIYEERARLEENVADKQRLVTSVTRDANAAEIKATADRQVANKALADAQAALEKLNSEIAEAAQNSGIDWSAYKIDPSTLNSMEGLKNAVEQIKQQAGPEATKVFQQLSQAFIASGKSADEARRILHAAGVELDELGDRASDIEHLRQSIVRFFSIGNAVQLFKRAIRSAVATIQDLDKVMTETAVVTDFSVSDMWKQLPEYTERANKLGVTIHDVYESATLYYQQGLKTNEVMAVSNATLKMARIASLDAAEATDRMTNALRGFNMEITETNANKVADVYSKLAAISASNVDEISTAMTKVASLASNANMQFETTSAFLAQIIETTRESAETAGTALKTVVARFSEVKKLYSEGQLLGNDEEGEAIDVNKVSTALRTAGINLNEYLAGAKGLDDIFMELASKWDSLDRVQQRYIATMAAGSRQQSRFIAMMQDYKRTTELVTAAQNAQGASQEQYQKTLDSLESKLNKLKNSWNTFLMDVTNSSIVKTVVDALTGLINAINTLSSILPGFISNILKMWAAFGAARGVKAIFGKNGSGISAFTSFITNTEGKILPFSNILGKLIGKVGLLGAKVTGTNKELGKFGMTLLSGVHKIFPQFGDGLAQSVTQSVAQTGASISIANASMLKFLGVLGGVAIGITAVIAIYNRFSLEGRLKRANKALEEASEKAADASNTFKELGDNLQSINDQSKSLENLTKYTNEWYEAVHNLNSEVLKLIETYPELAQYVKISSAGVMSIDEQDQKAVTETYRNRANQAQLQKAQAQITVGELKNKQASNRAYNRLYNLQDESENQILSTDDIDKLLNSTKLALDEADITEILGREIPDMWTTSIVNAVNAAKNEIQANDLETEAAIKSTIANILNSSDYGEAGQLIASLINSDIIKKQGKNLETGIQNFLRGITTEDQNLLKRLQSGEFQQGDQDLFESNTQLQNALKELGFNVEDLTKQLAENEKDVANREDKLSTFGLGDQSWAMDAGAATQNNIIDMFTNNKGVAQAISDWISSLGEDISDEDRQAIVSNLFDSSRDWGSIDALEKIENQFAGLGIEVNKLNLQPLITEIATITNAVTTIDPSKYAALTSFINDVSTKFASGDQLSTEEVSKLKSYGATNEDFIQVGEDAWVVNESSVQILKQKLEDAANHLLSTYVDTLAREDTDANRARMAQVEQTAGYNASSQREKTSSYTAGARTSLKQSDFGKLYDEKQLERATKGNKALADSLIASANAASKLLPQYNALTESIKDNADALEESDTQALKEVMNEFNNAFGTDVSTDFIDRYKTALIDFANGEKDAFDILTDAIIEENAEIFDEIGKDLETPLLYAGEQYEDLSSLIQGLNWDINGQAKLDNTDMIAALVENEEEAEYLRKKLLEAGIAMDITTKYEERKIGSYLDYDMFTGDWEQVDITAKVPTGTEVTLTNALGQKSKVNRQNNKNGSSGSKAKKGSSGKSKEKEKNWDNPYDELYNLIEQQNEALRTREKLEREYDRILKGRGKTARELYKQSLKEIDNIAREIEIQEKIQQGRQRMIGNLENQGYRGEDGTEKSFKDWGVTQYASYDAQTGVIKIDWEGIDKITNTDKGGAVEKYISTLEELSSSFEETQEKIEDMYDLVDEIKERGKEQYVDFEQKVYDSIVEKIQMQIDAYGELTDTIENSNNRIVDSLRESIDMQRQIRDNTKTEEDIADKEARLAYLRRDTSGANQNEILQLEKQLGEARESYGDTLIDQSLDQIAKENEIAIEQRRQQLEIMQAQLDYDEKMGVFWPEVYGFIMQAWGATDAEKLEAENQMLQEYYKWMVEQGFDLTEVKNTVQNGIDNTLPLDDQKRQKQILEATSTWETTTGQDIGSVKTALENQSTAEKDKQLLTDFFQKMFNEGHSMEDIINALTGDLSTLPNEEQKKAKEALESMNQWAADGGDLDTVRSYITNGMNSEGIVYDGSPLRNLFEETDAFKSMSEFGKKQWTAQLDEQSRQALEGFNNWIKDPQITVDNHVDVNVTVNVPETKEKVTTTAKSSNTKDTKTNPSKKKNDNTNKKKMSREEAEKKARAAAQEAQDTAMLKGEAYAANQGWYKDDWQYQAYMRSVGSNAAQVYQQTYQKKMKEYGYKKGGLVTSTGPAWLDGTKSAPEMVLSAKDTENFIALRNALTQMAAQGGGKGGDNYFDIQINVDEIANDYDVDKLAAKIKKQIYDDSSYRNVNAISYLR